MRTDAGRAGNWVKALREATAIDAAVAGSEAARNADMQTAALALRRAITDRDRDGAVNAANHITFLAAQLSPPITRRFRWKSRCSITTGVTWRLR